MTSSRGTDPLPERVGPYRVLQVLGEGGMGVVYEAEETGSVRRRVALKVIRAGLNSREVVARFEAERQALAVMNHPGIARVLHAGTTDTGEPFFAMELVRGLPLTQFCDTRRLALPERLELFIAVCQAVQHAHQKGVIHRDLKPTNILVTEQDGAAQPKIIDFGIAKALGQQLTEKTLVTLQGSTMGTAAYMSPEQVDAAGVDIDTRSDIYSLGVMLYELLVGQLPLEPGEVGVHLFLARLATGETNPPTPSVRFTASRERGAAVARSRRTDAVRLRKQLRGDLDWIVMKAMDADRARRYEAANGLAADLRRHLDNEPVLARPASTRYRLAKFVQRHRVGVGVAAVMSLAVLAGAVLATLGFVSASRAERRATREAAAAQQVTSFLVDLFKESDPGQSRGNTLTARELLERGAARVTNELSGQPLLQAQLMNTLGTVHQNLGMYAQAKPLLESAVRIRERELGADDPLVAETLIALGDAARSSGALEEAERYFRRALAIREARFGHEHPDVATALAALATIRVRQGKSAEAESLYKEVTALDARVRSPDDPRLARNLRGLAAVYWSQGRYGEAEPLWRRALEIQERTLGKDHYDVAGTLNNLGGLYWKLGRYEEALGFYDRARPIYERSLAPQHELVAGIYNNLAETYWKLKRYGEAEPLFRRALQIKEQILAPGSAAIAVTLNGLAGLLRDQGRFADAEPLYRRALEIREKALGATHRDTGETLRDYAELLRRTGRAAEAARLEERAKAIP